MKGINHKYLIWSAILLAVMWLMRPPDLSILDKPYSPMVNDSDGQLLSAHIATDQQWRLEMSGEVPERFHDAIITYEDKRYHYHIGVDPISLVRAISQNIRAGKVVSGASTITMQLARLSYEGAARTYSQKIKEIRLALQLELWHSKKDILRWYSSVAPFGGNVVGLTTASWRYYGKSPDQLSWSEAATLAVLPNAPSLIHVNRNRGQLLDKRDILLRRLLTHGYIDNTTLQLSIAEDLPNQLYDLPREAPHLLQSLHLIPSTDTVRINRSIQRTIQRNINRFYDEWSQNGVHNAGVIILDTPSGDIIGYVGNIPRTTEEADVDMIQARRSSGSILKPFLYAAMIDEGMIGASSIIRDVPIYIDGFSPSNYNRTFSGYVPADEALQRSLNIPAVLMLQKYGIDPLLKKLRSLGITTLDKHADHYGLSLILGGGEVTLYEIAHAYRRLALSSDGGSDSYHPGTAYATLETLKDLRRPDEEGEWRRFDADVPIAWKTGTSFGHRDAWAIGVTPEITIATWVGNADGEGRNGIIGTKLAGRLLFSILNNLELSGTWFTPPYEHLRWNHICHESGDLATPSCNNIDTLLTPIASRTLPNCKYHKKYLIENKSQLRLNENCNSNFETVLESFFDIDPGAADYYKINHPNFKPIPPLHPSCTGTDQLENISILYPTQGDRVYIPTDLNDEKQDLVIEAAHKDPASKVYWYLDEHYIGVTTDWHTKPVRPSAGKHTITLVDQSGHKISRQFEIINE